MTDNRNEMPPSLWAATAPPPPGTAPLDGAAAADVCVIGAGYTGLAAALAVAEAGARAIVLEAAEIGWGASGRNNGQVIPTLSRMDPDEIAARGGEKGEAFVGLIRDSASLVFDLIRRHGIDAEAVQNGWIQPAHRESRMKLAQRRVEAWGRRSAPVELLDRTAMRTLTGTDHWFGGWTNRTGGRINPLGYARGLARAVLSAGGVIHTRTPAIAIDRARGRWTVSTPHGSVTADRVIIATNAYSTGLWPGFREEVIPVRSYQMATAPLSDNVRKTILPEGHALSDTRGDLYFYRFDANGRLITGGALMFAFDWEHRIRERIARRAVGVYPLVGRPSFDYVWWGYVGVTADKAPHVHELAPGVTGWNGCNGRGVALATAIGRELGRQATGAPWRDIPLPLSPLKPIPAYGFAKRIAPAAILERRWRDARD
jgi:glycine/D-amino acid oxidase-like deaminating enzyme